jgi:hypothetical protein
VALLLRDKNLHNPSIGIEWKTGLTMAFVEDLLDVKGDAARVRGIVDAYSGFCKYVRDTKIEERLDEKPLMDVSAEKIISLRNNPERMLIRSLHLITLYRAKSCSPSSPSPPHHSCPRSKTPSSSGSSPVHLPQIQPKPTPPGKRLDSGSRRGGKRERLWMWIRGVVLLSRVGRRRRGSSSSRSVARRGCRTLRSGGRARSDGLAHCLLLLECSDVYMYSGGERTWEAFLRWRYTQ